MHRSATVALMLAALCTIPAGSSLLAAEPADACSLLNQSQVSAVLGLSVGAGVPSGRFVCQWSQPGDTSLGRKRVLVNLFGPIGKLTPADRFANEKAPVPGITKTPISGVGEDAFYITHPVTGTGLTVKKGSSVFRINIYGFSPDQTKTMEKTLALDALSKL